MMRWRVFKFCDLDWRVVCPSGLVLGFADWREAFDSASRMARMT